MYAEIVFALPFRNSFTYFIPPELRDLAVPGVRAVAPFGRRILTGFIIEVKENAGDDKKIKPIQDILDEYPVFDEIGFRFYKWLSDYYLSSLGEALKNSVPGGTDVETKRRIVSDKEIVTEEYEKEKDKNSVRARILKVLAEKQTAKISFLQKTVGKKNIYSTLRTLHNNGIVSIIDEIEKAKVRPKTEKYFRLKASEDEIFLKINEIEKSSPKQTKILLYILSNKKEEYAVAETLNKCGASLQSLKSLEEKGLVEFFDKEVKREFKEYIQEKDKEITPTADQQIIIDEVSARIKKKEFKSYLLHGVTGSGKTQVYIELTKEALALGKTVLILVPEISLTPQMTGRLIKNFGNKVSVLHSQMSLGEKYDSWRAVLKGETKIVVGARSALFAPLKNIGLIVVDEEHDQSYKQQELQPKYNARDAAIYRAYLEQCPVVLGSATPSIESMFNAENGKYELLQLKERIDNAKLPQIKFINTRVEAKLGNMDNVFSKFFIDEIRKRLERKEGVIILQNRRGFATQVFCEDCGEVEKCKNCSVGLVHHITNNILVCHYCGETKKVPKGCSKCGSVNQKFFGTGTQKVEDELLYHFPEAKIERIDSDSITKKGKLPLILNDFAKGKIDILVGTQMVSKGLDFPNVSLVGVISAETGLWMPDFRADERSFQLLTQVSGRAGRSEIEGEVLIQTVDEKNFVLQRVLDGDYNAFYERELKIRKKYLYPPFSRLCLVEFRNPDLRKVQGAVLEFHKLMLRFKHKLIVSEPTEAMISKLKGNYRYQLMLRTLTETDPNGSYLRNAIMDSYFEYNTKSRFKEIRPYFDIDPQNVV